MDLIKKVTFVRNVHGYPEATEVNVWMTWCYGCQVFIVHQVRNGRDDFRSAMDEGEWFLTDLGLCKYMLQFRDSFINDTTIDFSTTLEFDKPLKELLQNDHDDGDKWRIIIRDLDPEVNRMVQQGFIKVQATGAYGVRIDRRFDFIQPPMLTSLTAKLGPDVYTSLQTTRVVALGLAATNLDTPWARTMQVVFKKPAVIIERQNESGEWEEHERYNVLNPNYTLKFNKDCTDTVVAHLE